MSHFCFLEILSCGLPETHSQIVPENQRLEDEMSFYGMAGMADFQGLLEGILTLISELRRFYHRCFRNPVNSPVEDGSVPHYFQGYTSQVVVNGISEPSTVSQIHELANKGHQARSP